MGRYRFKVVRSFKYLGISFDQQASAKHMIEHTIVKARKVFYWLLRFLASNAWNTPHTRLVLFNVYVRTILQFGAPVWAPSLLDFHSASEHAVLRPLLVQ